MKSVGKKFETRRSTTKSNTIKHKPSSRESTQVHKMIYLFAFAFTFAFASINGISATCDSSRLIRCQQELLRDLQVISPLNAASVQYPISGPPYSPAAAAKQREQQQLASAGATSCRLVRANLDCVLATNPNCYEAGLQAAQNSDVVLRAKRFLEQAGCNEPEATWQTTFCYRSAEIRGCEERYDFTAYGRTTLTANATACLAYQAFKYCVELYLRTSCKVHEIDMVNEYLIDRAGDLAWRCPQNTSAPSQLGYPSPYALNNPSPTGQLLSPVAYGHGGYGGGGGGSALGSNYEQRPIPTYVGSSQQANVNLFGTVRDQPWERFRNPLEETRYGISRQPGLIGASGTGEVFDRLIAANAGFDVDNNSDCPVRAAPFARECERTLSEQLILARDSRDGNELGRRTCCSLFQYRDCISRVVLDRCADSTPAAVEILMGTRRREMALTCRTFNRDVCSGATARLAAATATSWIALAAALFLGTFMTLKQQAQ